MPHAPLTRPPGPPHPEQRRPVPRRFAAHRWSPGRRRPDAQLVAELYEVIADAHQLDPAQLRARPDAPVAAGSLRLLGAGPLRTAADASARLDALARALVDRMQQAGWAEIAAPGAVTSVLAASVPAAETVLLRAARSRRR